MKNPIIVAELKRLAEEHGGTLKPSDVVASARAEESPLHPHFTWDDDAAAEQWRLHQARNLINAVVIAYPAGSREPIEHRVFVSLTTDRQKNGEGYRLMVDAMSDEQHRAQLLADAKQDLIGFKSRYRSLTELADVFAAIDQVVTVADERETVGAGR